MFTLYVLTFFIFKGPETNLYNSIQLLTEQYSCSPSCL